MIRVVILMAFLLFSVLSVFGEGVSLSGAVKKNGTAAGIADVKITLANKPDLSATSGADGSFNLESTSLRSSGRHAGAPSIALQSGSILFIRNLPDAIGKLDLFSVTGGKMVSIELDNRRNGACRMPLPLLVPGIYLLRITFGDVVIIHTLISLDRIMALTNGSMAISTAASRSSSASGVSPAIDTLIASKNGYLTQKNPIDTYTKSGIQIELDSATSGGLCTRESLNAFAEKYIDAQKAGDLSKMPLAPDAKFFQNMKATTAEKSICKTGLPIAFHRTFIDVDSCATFTEVIDTAKSHPYVVGMRLKISGDLISEVHAMVTDKGDWLFSADSYLTRCTVEDWGEVPEVKRMSRQALINGCNAYFNYIFDWTTDTVPWGNPCNRLEGGAALTSPTCNVGAKGNSVKTTYRSFVVDTTVNVVNIFCYFGFGPDSHAFRFVDKKYRFIHTMTACGDTVGSGKACWGASSKAGSGKGYGE